MHVLVDAFVDNNLGDDLMLHMLVHRFPDCRFFALRDADLNLREPYRAWPNFLVPDWRHLDALLPFMDAFLIVGGSMWQDHGNNLEWYHWRQFAMERIQAKGGKVLALGNNVGPVHGEEGAQLFANLIGRLDGMVVRDRASQVWVDARVGPGRAELGADMVFAYPLRSFRPKERLVGISVHRTILRPERNLPYQRNLVRLIDRLHKADPDLRVRLLGFDAVTECDDILIDLIRDDLDDPPYLDQAVYRGNLDGFLEAVGECERLFASRFHALVLALKLGIPFVPFDYLGKARSLLEDLDYRGILVTHETFGQDLDAIGEALLRPALHHDAERLSGMTARADRALEAFAPLAAGADPFAAKELLLGLLDALSPRS